MDTFYEENQENNIRLLKNKMTLDFNSPTSHSKKAKLIKTCILESPDLKMLKLASPELERMIIAQNGLVTTTPTPGAIPGYFMKQEQEVTEEQELYARGFVDALNQLHQINGQQHPNHCLNSSQLSNTNNQNSNTNHTNSITNSSNNNNCNQNNSHLNNNQNIINNNNNNSHSSDSSADLTIADSNGNNCNNNNNSNNRRNSYHMLVPAVTTASSTVGHQQPVPLSQPNTTSAVGFNANTNNANNNCNNGPKFAIPHIPSQQDQYVSVSTCLSSGQTTGAQVLINQNHQNNSVLPPYSQAVTHNSHNHNNSVYTMQIKAEPTQPQSANQSIPTSTQLAMRGLSPPLSPGQQTSLAPIDMADQERIKLERKRLRNRIAASKCRRRKLERISRLEDKVRGLKGENSELSIVVNKLRDQVCGLKQQVMDHVKCGCQLMVPQ